MSVGERNLARNHDLAPNRRPYKIIGETINNCFARSARAWKARDITGFQKLAKLQADLGSEYVGVNVDGTQKLRVTLDEMLAFLTDLIPAIQEVTNVPLVFDNPSVHFHRRCLELYDRSRSGQPIFNSIAASRARLEEMLELIAEYDTMVIGMASEKFVKGGGGAQCLSADDVYGAACELVELLRTKAGRTNDQILIDPGLAPVGADTYGIVNMGLDAMKKI
ncbi:MAG: dihydropteroate synthase, partial [Deltaproteobacteria bacterium]|nr:dihydropteroate synthase [Deltaproteobacteria bacterium]